MLLRKYIFYYLNIFILLKIIWYSDYMKIILFCEIHVKYLEVKIHGIFLNNPFPPIKEIVLVLGGDKWTTCKMLMTFLRVAQESEGNTLRLEGERRRAMFRCRTGSSLRRQLGRSWQSGVGERPWSHLLPSVIPWADPPRSQRAGNPWSMKIHLIEYRGRHKYEGWVDLMGLVHCNFECLEIFIIYSLKWRNVYFLPLGNKD